MSYKLIDTEYNWNEAILLEQEIYSECEQMKENGFHLDKEETNRQIKELDERIKWAESMLIPMIPPKSKMAYTTHVKKVFKINGDYTKAVKDWFGEEVSLDLVEGEFSRVEYNTINLNSSVQVKNWLEKNGWKPDSWNYQKDSKGKEIRLPDGSKIKTTPKITDSSLENLDIGPAGKVYQYYRKCTHKRNTLAGLLSQVRKDGTVPSYVNTLGASSFRMTHSVIVNIPAPKKAQKGEFIWKPMRKCFTVPEGYKLVGCDADQCQVRGLAHYMNNKEFIEALVNGDKKKGTDIHSFNAKAAGLKERDHSKTVFYGYLFGAGKGKTASQLGITVEEADKIRKKFEKNLVGLTQLLKELKKFWSLHGYIVGLDGRKVFVPSEHMLLVYLLQCFETVVMRRALVIALDKIKQQGLEAYLVTMQHDEFQFRVKEEHANQVAKILEESIYLSGTFYNLNCPITGKAKIGNNWLETH